MSLSELRSLGKNTAIPTEPSRDILESAPNPHPDVDYVVKLTCPEFTSICPLTSQPDFAHLVIEYVPGELIIESKSLKLYLFSFRNHGSFHEDCTVRIGKDIANVINPKWLRIGGYWYPRGGIPIDIFFQLGKLPKNIWLNEQQVSNYRGRG